MGSWSTPKRSPSDCGCVSHVPTQLAAVVTWRCSSIPQHRLSVLTPSHLPSMLPELSPERVADVDVSHFEKRCMKTSTSGCPPTFFFSADGKAATRVLEDCSSVFGCTDQRQNLENKASKSSVVQIPNISGFHVTGAGNKICFSQVQHPTRVCSRISVAFSPLHRSRLCTSPTSVATSCFSEIFLDLLFWEQSRLPGPTRHRVSLKAGLRQADVP